MTTDDGYLPASFGLAMERSEAAAEPVRRHILRLASCSPSILTATRAAYLRCSGAVEEERMPPNVFALGHRLNELGADELLYIALAVLEVCADRTLARLVARLNRTDEAAYIAYRLWRPEAPAAG